MRSELLRTSLPRDSQQLLELLGHVTLSSRLWINLEPHLVPTLGLQLPLMLLQDVRCPKMSEVLIYRAFTIYHATKARV